MAIHSDLKGNEVQLDLSIENVIQKLRHAMISEFDAIATYDAIIKGTGDDIVKKTLTDIRDEEMLHAGQLNGLLKHLEKHYEQKFNAGEKEFQIDLQKK